MMCLGSSGKQLKALDCVTHMESWIVLAPDFGPGLVAVVLESAPADGRYVFLCLVISGSQILKTSDYAG